MHKYWVMFLSGLQTTLEYRGHLVMWVVVELMTLSSALFLWAGVFTTHEMVGAYQYRQMILYYFLIPVIAAITSVHISEKLPRRIKDGEISKDLVKPYSYVFGFILNQLAFKTMHTLLKLPVYVVVGMLLFTQFDLSLLPSNIIFGLGAALIGLTLNIIMDTTLSLVAFWFDDIWSLSLIKYVTMSVFGGLAYPIDLVPTKWRLLYDVLPFDLIFYFPVKVMMGSDLPLSWYLMKGFIWMVILFMAGRWMWQKGIKKYGAYGQ